MSVDPLAHETLEPYVYTGNNPMMLVDPDGRESRSMNDIDPPRITDINNFHQITKIFEYIAANKDELPFKASITEFVDFNAVNETGGFEKVKSQHHDFIISTGENDNSDATIIGHDETILKMDPLIVDESNLKITYRTENGKRLVRYTSDNGKPLQGIIRMVIPAYDPMLSGGENRLTGLQIKFDVSDPKQLQAFKSLNNSMGGVWVDPRREYKPKN